MPCCWCLRIIGSSDNTKKLLIDGATGKLSEKAFSQKIFPLKFAIMTFKAEQDTVCPRILAIFPCVIF